MTVEENILAILEANNVPEKERYEKMNALVEEFHIDHIRKNKGTELPAVNAAAWKLPALWQQTRRSFCWMSLLPVSTDCRCRYSEYDCPSCAARHRYSDYRP